MEIDKGVVLEEVLPVFFTHTAHNNLNRLLRHFFEYVWQSGAPKPPPQLASEVAYLSQAHFFTSLQKRGYLQGAFVVPTTPTFRLAEHFDANLEQPLPEKPKQQGT